MRFNRSILVGIIGSALVAFLIIICAFVIGIHAKAKVPIGNGTYETIKSHVLLGDKGVLDAAKDGDKTSKEFIAMYSLAIIMALVATIFQVLRIILNEKLDVFNIILSMALILAAIVFMAAETGKQMKDLLDQKKYLIEPDYGFFAANFIVHIIGGLAGAAIVGIGFKRDWR